VVQATQGWRVEEGDHYKAFAPDGETIITISKTPGSQTRIKAYKAQFAKLIPVRNHRARRCAAEPKFSAGMRLSGLRVLIRGC
jgi:hypothetical protein